jgi:DNA-binding beta-propeller fold protein YncE
MLRLRQRRFGRRIISSLAGTAIVLTMAAAPSAHAAYSVSAARTPQVPAAASTGRSALARWLKRFPARPQARAITGSRASNGKTAVAADLLRATSSPPPVIPVPTVAAGDGPNGVATDDATHTIYVANGGTAAPGSTVSVINDRHCRSRDISGCGQTPATLTVGSVPIGVAVNQATQTLYVTNGIDNTVSVVNTATCSALHPGGCASQHPPAFPVGTFPVQALVDASTDTLYVANGGGNTVSVIDGGTCNSHTVAGCTAVATVTVGDGPDYLLGDPATQTLYVLNAGTDTPGNTVSLISTATCNAHTTAGCAVLATATVGLGPFGGAFDPANHTVYTANAEDNTVSLIDSRTCNARHTAGCTKPVPSFNGGNGPTTVTADRAVHTFYVDNTDDDTLAALNTRTCNSTRQSGCRPIPPTVQAGAGPGFSILDQGTGTVYASNVDDGTMSVVNPRTCRAGATTGCRVLVAATAVGAFPTNITPDPAVHTAYVSNDGGSTISMINTSKCRARHLEGCGATWRAAAVVAGPNDIKLDRPTHTVYVASSGPGDGTTRGAVTVLNDTTCNATSTGGCAPAFTIRPALPLNPVYLAVDDAKHTVYVLAENFDATATNEKNYLLLFNQSTCNAQRTSGCRQPLVKIPLGNIGGGYLLLDQATDSLYLSNPFAPGTGHTVSVFSTATCNITDQAGCGRPAATILAGSTPYGIALGQASKTLYVANLTGVEGHGTLSMINAATCNADHPAGCTRTWPVAVTPHGPIELAVDQRTGTVIVSDFSDSTVAVIDGPRCNAAHPSGCAPAPPKFAVSSIPIAVAVDPGTHTAYIADALNGLVSVLRVRRP